MCETQLDNEDSSQIQMEYCLTEKTGGLVPEVGGGILVFGERDQICTSSALI